MHDLLDQIDAAAAARLYYVALSTALIVPDIAGALDSDDGRATGLKYAKWFDENVGQQYEILGDQSLLGIDCYYFRCSMLHQGAAQIQSNKSTVSRIFFLEPGTQFVLHNCLMKCGEEQVLSIDVETFCGDITASARQWLQKAQGTPKFKENFSKCVARHSNGLPPYVVGKPVIG